MQKISKIFLLALLALGLVSGVQAKSTNVLKLTSPKEDAVLESPFIKVTGSVTDTTDKILFYIDDTQRTVHGHKFIKPDSTGAFQVFLPVLGTSQQTLQLKVVVKDSSKKIVDSATRTVTLNHDFQMQTFAGSLELTELLHHAKSGDFEIDGYVINSAGGFSQTSKVSMQDVSLKGDKVNVQDFSLSLITNSNYLLIVRHLNEIVGFKTLNTGDLKASDIIKMTTQGNSADRCTDWLLCS